ncbi:hypothetical protein HJC04_11360 [Rhizobium sp. NLR8a]|uniref:hypothetical protein n=1 Tax=Rhizobium TaxID=379 RepID=UPI001C82D7D4|nr:MULTISPECIES: hypothetical protein [Rhizobium]MBX5153226.1 hypothetical protein [Rhizobium lentis]MBX5220899.1 hypothetical protein [Rhizobium sp. NLR8a]
MDISIDRLRRLAENKSASHSALSAAWQAVSSAKDDVARAQRDLDAQKTYSGIRRDPKGDEPFEIALTRAKEQLGRAEANHSRIYDEFELSANLARRGFDFARERMALPPEILEAFK